MRLIVVGGWRGKAERWFRQEGQRRRGTKFIGVVARDLVWFGATLRRLLCPRPPVSVPVPVLSVGNLTVGGTGKTPFVRWIATCLQKEGFHPAVLTPLPDDADEVQEYREEGISIFGSRDRVAAAFRALRRGADILILDDGFQYRRLRRDLDIVLWDVTTPVDPLHPFLREPLVMLRRADLIVLSKAEALGEAQRRRVQKALEGWAGAGKVTAGFDYEVAGIFRLPGMEPLFNAREKLQGKPILLATGIADPFSFARTVIKFGCDPIALICFPDHHPFTDSDILFVVHQARREGATAVMTTMKDAVKWRPLWAHPIPLFALKVTLKWLWGSERVWENLKRVTGGKTPP